MNSIPQAWRLPIVVVLFCGCLIGIVGFGARAGFGLFLKPISTEFQWGREVFALSIAIQNLIWGAAQPFAGALADKYGSGRVLALGGLAYAAGVALMAYSSEPWQMHLTGGVLVGLGTAFASFMIVMATLARRVAPKWRTLVFGIATASGSVGQFTLVPLGQSFLTAYGWHTALLLLAAIVLLIVPLSVTITGKGAAAPGTQDQSIREAIREAFAHRSYRLLVAGFFVCGFHVAFILVHMPPYIVDRGLPPDTAAVALAMVGLFNIVGSLSAGYVGGKFSKRYSLAAIYLLRAIAIAIFITAPISQTTVYIFAGTMGLLWLSTVPLTSGLVGQFFGLRYMGMLFGVVFFSHQVGSFLGVWLGGLLYDTTGTYDVVWWLSVALGVAAALVHLPIRETPVARLAGATA
ncbi:MAG: MFS transporter [Rhodospirillaceae bacterium]|nr:MFS transporter [Rhodospirillaceae bacterium]